MASPVLQLRVPEDTLNRIDDVRGEDSRSAWLLAVIDRELTGDGPPAVVPVAGGAADPGVPSNGVLCMGPGCWQRDTRKYGLRKIPLCRACRMALDGEVHAREIPSAAAVKLAKRGAA